MAEKPIGKKVKKQKVVKEVEIFKLNVVEEPQPKVKRAKKIIDNTLRVFDCNDLRNKDKFSFKSPGRANNEYICTVKNSVVILKRNDGKEFKRNLCDIPYLVKTYNLNCTLLNGE